ncbi:MAG: PorP/SprF family type IX secretion system membrane protein [Flavobacteriales bacterium]|nr:PorP/SprF family type IX secretion system membrane protein [Flavobacteriales bacterium]
MALTTINHQLSTTQAQQISQYTQYVFNHYSVQPAVAGSKDCFDGRLGFRRQWGGIQGMPVTAWATIHGALRSKKPFVKNKHGFGVNIEADDTGPIGYTHFYLGWAYHANGPGLHAEHGPVRRVEAVQTGSGRGDLGQPERSAVTGNKSVMVWPEIAPGIWAYGKNFWLGASMFGTFNNPIRGVGTDSRYTRHYLLSAGYRYRIGKKTAFIPSTLWKIGPGSPMAMDINVQMEWVKKVAVGVSYRNVDAFAVMGRINFMKYFSLGYSYDITTSLLRQGSSNTHEIILVSLPVRPMRAARSPVACPVWE